MNFGCIATGILQMIALNFHETIWRKYQGWLRTVTSAMFRKGMLGPGIYHTNPASYVKARPQIKRWLEIAASENPVKT